jgi:hypothetical protein
MATNAARREIRRLVYMRQMTMMIPLDGPSQSGGAELGLIRIESEEDGAEGLVGRVRARRLQWVSMTKAELTAENRPAYKDQVRQLTRANNE